MKKILDLFTISSILALGFLVSCQDEFSESRQSPGLLSKDSLVSQRIMVLTANNTSIDNVIDSTDCFSVKLPVQVLLNGEQVVTVQSPENYAIVEDILQGTPVGGSVDFVYPITLITASYAEIVVNNEDQFVGAVADCIGFESSSCLEVNYPITATTYDTGTQNPSVQTIDNNQEFYLLIFNLAMTEVYTIQFPVTITQANGENITVSSNAELELAIADPSAACSCNNPDVLTDDLILYLTFANEINDLTGFGASAAVGETQFVGDRDDNPAAALSFETSDAENQVITPGNPSNNMLQDQAFTVSIWFNRQNTGNVVPSQEFLFSNSEMSLFISNVNQVEYQPRFFVAGQTLADNTWFEQQLGAQINVWHHLAVTFSGDVIMMYRDGNLVAETANVSFAGTSIAPNFIGGNFRGFVDDVRVYRRALDAAEIQTLFNLEGDISTCLD